MIKVLLACTFIAGMIWRIWAAVRFPGFTADVGCFTAWASAAAKDLSNFYTSGMFADYPPAYMYVLWLVGKIAVWGQWSNHLSWLVRIPSILADLATAWMIYRYARKYMSERTALFLAAAYTFNPAVLINAAYWGQVDSFFTLLVVCALLCLHSHRLHGAAVLFALSVLMKPQGIVFLPVLLFYLVGKKKAISFLWVFLIAVGTAAIVILPFSRDPLWIFRLILGTGEQYPYASLNAFNLFAFFGGNLQNDSQRLGIFSYQVWGGILDAGLFVLAAAIYFKGKREGEKKLWIAALLLNAGFFMLSSRMHERYMFPAVALALFCFILYQDRRLLRLYIFLSAAVFINTYAVLYKMTAERTPHFPAVHMGMRAASLLNVLIFAYLVYVCWNIAVQGKVSTWNPYASPSGWNKLQPGSRNGRMDGKDRWIMAGMTIIYTAAALINLGSLQAPNTPWQPAKRGEWAVLDLGKVWDISAISYYGGLNARQYDKGSFTLEYESGQGNYQRLGSYSKTEFYSWKPIPCDIRTRRIRITAITPGIAINEVGVFEKGTKKPIQNIRLVYAQEVAHLHGPGNLTDEQTLVQLQPSYFTGTYFDEIYHARTALEHLKKMEPYESTHPPLGKLMISLGILIFGMNPFGWRVVGTLVGAAMIPLMYAFGRKLFEKRFYAFCCAFLLMFDCMHFTQTRIATIDVYGVFFILLMYYFMYNTFHPKAYEDNPRTWLRSTLLSGLFFGIGVACKWITLYGGVGLALLWLICRVHEIKNWLAARSLQKDSGAVYLHDGQGSHILSRLWRITLWSALSFVLLPGVIYLLSYIPFLQVPGPGHGVKDIFTYQIHMFSYHKNLIADHPFSSPWWSWPLMLKPVWYYSGAGLAAGKTSTIVALGNPVIWWTGMLAVGAAFVLAVRKKDARLVPVLLALLFQYIPWILVERLTFLYHFFSIVPFMIFCIVYIIETLESRWPKARYIVWAYLAAAAVLFVVFYPVLSGMQVNASYVNGLHWLGRWVF